MSSSDIIHTTTANYNKVVHGNANIDAKGDVGPLFNGTALTSLSSMARSSMLSSMSKSGGTYVPPARLALMQKDILVTQDKSTEAYQRVSWDALKKSINGLINKVSLLDERFVGISFVG